MRAKTHDLCYTDFKPEEEEKCTYLRDDNRKLSRQTPDSFKFKFNTRKGRTAARLILRIPAKSDKKIRPDLSYLNNKTPSHKRSTKKQFKTTRSLLTKLKSS